MRIAVIGAGIGGMSAAFDFINAGHQVVIYESAPYVGGLAAGFKDEGWEWSVEHFYHHWFQSDRDMLGLIRELGLQDKVVFPRPKTVVYYKEKFYPLDSPLAALTFPGFTLPDMIRFGLVTAYLRYLADWKPLEKVTADEWMRKAYGERLYSVLFEPLLQGKFGQHYKSVNMAWFWARFKVRTTRLGTFQGGFQAFSDTFAEILRKRGVEIHLNTPVERIESGTNGQVNILLKEGEQVSFDQCLVTVGPGLLAKLAPGLPEDYLRGLLTLKSMGAVVMVLALRHPLSEEGYYWFNIPKSAGYPFLALVEHTNFLPSRYFGGDHIVYIGDYLDADHEHFRLSKEELLERFLPVLPRFNPRFEPGWVRKTWLFRTTYAQPVPLVNHSQNIPAIRTPLPGLYFASMSQVYPWDRGTNFAVQIARRAAKMMLEDLTKRN
ncbi:protoporphyrinogen oxidase [Bellilinea caldifistulae]|uniref:Oxidoreductase n=1 Tax=Bellilinea caldifistulae TaxID=360411 RepID=A0A0P6X6M0_9CHLR|nr:NAD(P)/FAD-dependent oxidoreductase [Bellilinea caldifistulae]KPL77591.1 oxidoreductase [Bellilinea caldifistulae]GAP09615.1 protoporphyrinogen oxidase [Bellilinea caldifistulae]